MSAVAERSRRATAGQRMTVLTGEALEQDQSFWGHDTWVDDDSGNESFHSSDEDSVNKKDIFDSDFDESESDNEDDEQEAAMDEEREIQKQEKNQRVSSKRSYVDIDRPAVKGVSILKKKGKVGKVTTKRIIGDGLNAGIVLNAPTPMIQFNSTSTVPPNQLLPTELLKPPPTPSEFVKIKKEKNVRAIATIPLRRATRFGNDTSGEEVDTKKKKKGSSRVGTTSTTGGTSVVKRVRKRYTQEELLIEAVSTTEPENVRWILGRKRIQDESEKEKVNTNREGRGKTIQKFVSRRGYLNTINFPDMDHIPSIFSRSIDEVKSPPVPLFCAITGKVARYRDPKTNLGYYDVLAFKELRRQYEANELHIMNSNNSIPEKINITPEVTNNTNVPHISLSQGRPEHNVTITLLDTDVETKVPSYPPISTINQTSTNVGKGKKRKTPVSSTKSSTIDSAPSKKASKSLGKSTTSRSKATPTATLTTGIVQQPIVESIQTTKMMNMTTIPSNTMNKNGLEETIIELSSSSSSSATVVETLNTATVGDHHHQALEIIKENSQNDIISSEHPFN